MIIDYINTYGSISPLEAIRDLGCYRLAARVAQIKVRGYKVVTEMKTVTSSRTGRKSRIAIYSFEDSEKDRKYFTPADVKNMTQEEVRKNYTDIMRSMKSWG
jgi:hypothetical protein